MNLKQCGTRLQKASGFLLNLPEFYDYVPVLRIVRPQNRFWTCRTLLRIFLDVRYSFPGTMSVRSTHVLCPMTVYVMTSKASCSFPDLNQNILDRWLFPS